MLKIHAESHLDHAINKAVIDYVLAQFADRDGFFIETITLPAELGTVPCGLYGPLMGDPPVQSSEVFVGRRANRQYDARFTLRPSRQVNTVSIIAGPYQGNSCIVYSIFGGPVAPKELGDPTLKGEEEEASVKFWSEHALSR